LTANDPEKSLIRWRLETNVRHLDPGDVAFVKIEFDMSILLADVI
jgi:hypothetical protein